MTEEERRRCIILGICGPGGQATGGPGGGPNPARRAALLEVIQEKGGSVGEEALDEILGLIDEARAGEKGE